MKTFWRHLCSKYGTQGAALLVYAGVVGTIGLVILYLVFPR